MDRGAWWATVHVVAKIHLSQGLITAAAFLPLTLHHFQPPQDTKNLCRNSRTSQRLEGGGWRIAGEDFCFWPIQLWYCESLPLPSIPRPWPRRNSQYEVCILGKKESLCAEFWGMRWERGRVLPRDLQPVPKASVILVELEVTSQCSSLAVCPHGRGFID